MIEVLTFFTVIFGAAVAVGLVMFGCFALCYAYDCILNWFTNEH